MDNLISEHTIILSLKEHKGEQRLFAKFPYDNELIKIIRTIPGASWSSSKKEWHFNLNRQVVQLLETKLSSLAKVDTALLKTQWIEKEQAEKNEKYKGIDAETIKAIDYYKLWMEQKRYSVNTIKNYMAQLLQFLRYHQPRIYKELTVEDVEKYNHTVIIGNKLSVSFQRNLVGTIKLFYSQCADTKMNLSKLHG